MMAKLRFESLDSLRGICAVLVIFYHSTTLSVIARCAFVQNSYLFVDFFFVLSGFVIAHAYQSKIRQGADLRDFLLLRLGRIYPMHFLLLCIFILIELAKLLASSRVAFGTGSFEPGGGTSPASIVTNLLLVQSLGFHTTPTWNVPSWSISCEFIVYILFGLFLLYLKNKWFVLAAAGLASCMTIAVFSKNGMNATYDFGIFRCIYGFSVGVICERIFTRLRWDRLPGRWRASGAEWAAAALVAVYIAEAGQNSALLAPLVFGIAVLVFAGDAGNLSRILRSGIFAFLGTLSYSIYMNQWLVRVFIGAVFKRLDRRSPGAFVDLASTSDFQVILGGSLIPPVAFDFMLVVLTVALSVITFRFVEDPCRKYSRVLVKKLSAPSAAIQPAAPH